MQPLASSSRKVDRIIGGILQDGVIAAGLLVFAGGVLYLVDQGRAPADYTTFQANRAALHSVRAVVRNAAHLDGRAVIQLGLLVLIATPVTRVIFSVFAFSAQRDWLYVLFTLVVLAILVYSLFGGAG